MDDLTRQTAINHWRAIIDATDESNKYNMGFVDGIEFCINDLSTMPSAQPEPQEIGYTDCANAMLKMWIDNVLTDGEYSRIMDKLNAHWAERRTDERSNQQTGIM